MRDIAVTLLILGLFPFVLKRPWIGILLWLWVSTMSPQRFTWGFAYNLPFAAMIGVVTLISLIKNRDQVKLPINPITILYVLFPLWMCVTSIFALEPNAELYERWKLLMKIFFFLLIGASLINSRKQVEWLTWTIVFSVGFFGVKGGIFTILTGGASRVYGPPGTGFMSDNNAISIALVMVIPLMYFLRTITDSKWVKHGLLVAMGLSTMAVLGSQSRGAFLAILVMMLFLWIKSSNKLILGVLMVVLLPVAIGFMPDTWTERMRSIETYQMDSSAMGRINAWTMAFNLANDRPLVGGGFEIYNVKTFAKYAPDPTDVHAAHSIYFQILGEHGYVGLVLFLSIGFVAWATARRIIKISRSNPDLAWAASFAGAIQVSLLGYATGGAFINIGYWEIQYYLIMALMVVYSLIKPPVPSRTYAI